MHTENQERLLRLLTTEHQRFRSMPPPVKPKRLPAPYPALEALVGMSEEDVRRSLGEPDDFQPTSGDGLQTWEYEFSRRPPRWRGNALHLELRFGAGTKCIGARWQLSR